MSLVSKYAVPFNNRRATSNSNVVNKLVLGGVGYLKIELPVNPAVNNCIGFKIKVVSEDNKDLLFEGHISGSSSDGYKWIYTSSDQSEDSKILGNPVLFCYKYLSEDDKSEKNVLKSVLLGSETADWGKLIRITIELLQVTLETAPDGEENVVRTSSVNEYDAEAVSTDESEKSSKWTDGWRFEIGQITDEIIAIRDSGVIKDNVTTLTIDGVVSGVAKSDENGNIVVTTEFTNNTIDLFNKVSNSYGLIIADGSKLVNLGKNEELLNLSLKSSGLSSPITIKSDPDSDVSLNLILENAGEVHNPKLNIDKFIQGTWSDLNSIKFSVKTSDEVGENSPVNKVKLGIGDLGLITNGANTSLYVGTGSGNKVVGGAVICSTQEEFDLLDKIDGKIVYYDGRIYVCSGGEYSEVKPSGKLSLDEIKNGYFYEKVNADAQLGGEIVRLRHDDGLLLSNDIYSHIIDESIHITKDDRIRWDSKISAGDSYTKEEVNDMFDAYTVSSLHYHGYHDPINLIVEPTHDFTTHNYPYGHRILVNGSDSYPPYIRVAGEPNEWITREEFEIGDKVTEAYSDYNEYINIDNKIVKIPRVSSVFSIDVVRKDRQPSEYDASLMKTGDWYVYEGGYDI